MNKKAFEIQFNWLFVLVAGAAILLFFTFIAVKQKSISDTSAKAIVLKSIEAIITGTIASADTTNIIDIPNSEIEISCGRVSLGAMSKQYQSMILFAPSTIKGSKLITQTSMFNVPYRAVNLLYITSPDVRYIIIGESALAKEINKSLPKDIRKEFYPYLTPPLIRNQNNYKVRFIFFDNIDETVLENFKSMLNSDVTAINVIEEDEESGTIVFYQKNELSWDELKTEPYLTSSLLLGAVYSDTPEAYNCNANNAFARLRLITQVYSERTTILKDIEDDQCRQIYDAALDELNDIFIASSGFDEEGNIETIAAAVKSLSIKNKEAQKSSCTLIY